MFALKPRIEIATGILAITVVLFSALVPVPVLAEGSDVSKNYDELSPVGYFESGLERPGNPNTVDPGVLEDVADCSLDGSGVLVVSFGTTCALGPGEYTFHVVYVDPEATLILKGNPTTGEGVSIHAESITINSFVDGQGIRHDGSIRADGQGHPSGMGLGRGADGTDVDHFAGGGGYGGEGGIGKGGTLGGIGYGSIYTPIALGSGGGNTGSGSGGAGGGAIKLDVVNTITVNGRISADGLQGEYDDVLRSYGGGGSGGSIWIKAASLTGSGTVSASGGYSYCGGNGCPGGGAGGRVAVDVPIAGNTFTGNIYSEGQESNYDTGGAGTIYWTTENKLVVMGPGSSYSPKNTILVEEDDDFNFNFDTIDIRGFANVRIVGANTSLTINPDTVMLGDGSNYITSNHYKYGRLEVEGMVHIPDDLVIKNFMLVPLRGLVADLDGTIEELPNVTITDEGGLEVHADASPLPNGVYQFDNITVGNGSSWKDTLRLVPFKNDNEDYMDDYGVTLLANNITINSGGLIEAYGQGYRAGGGPGKGMDGISQGGGGGHGGEGGDSANGNKGGDGYGNIVAPITLGSGGGNIEGGLGGGAGGGAIKLDVENALTLNGGNISVEGERGGYRDGVLGGGGGAGGSIWIIANSILTENYCGWIYAGGGEGYSRYDDGGGAGGRIVIDVSTVNACANYTFMDAKGAGDIFATGGTGTIYWTVQDKLVVGWSSSYSSSKTILTEGNYEFDTIDLTDHASVMIKGEASTLTLTNTTFIGDGTGRLAVEGTIIAPTDFTFSGGVILSVLNGFTGLENITLQNGGGLELYAGVRPDPDPELRGAYSFGNVTVANGGRLRLVSFDDGDTDFYDDYGVTLHVENLTVETGGVVEADGQGYPAASGRGKGADATGEYYEQAGGGGHGGDGGDGDGNNTGGAAYDNIYAPIMLGSGGGNTETGAIGGAGGGAFKLDVENVLTLNGIISSNGQDGDRQLEGYGGTSGGGAGGSIWIIAPSVTGSGTIQANGGKGLLYETCPYGSGCTPRGYSGGGGGGRIAVDANELAPTINMFVQGGVASSSNSGKRGTVFDGAVDQNISTVEIVPSGGVTADGGAAATLTVTLLDKNGIAIIDEPVEIALVSGWGLDILNVGPVGTIYVPIGYTDEDGTVTAALVTTKAGPKTLKARSGQIEIIDQASVTFVAGAPSIRDSSFEVSRPTAPADGQTAVTVTATILDSYGNPVPGETVNLDVTAEHALVTLLSSTEPITDEQGEVQWEIKDAYSEIVALRAWVGANELANPPSINFKGADVSVWMTSPAEAPADRNAEISYIVKVRNAYFLPAPDTTLTITLPEGVSCVDDTLEDPGICQTGQVVTPWNIGTLDPGEELSFTLYARIDSTWDIGETLQTTATVTTTTFDDDETNNSFTASALMVSGYKFEGTLSPASQSMGIGGTAEFVIEVENTGLLADEYAVNINGLDEELYTLSQTTFGLSPQEKDQVTLSVHYDSVTCSEAGSYPFNFNVDVVGQAQNETQSYPGAVTFQSSPTISDLRPEPGSLIGSRDVTISWRTDTPTTGVVTVSGGPNGPQTYSSTVMGTSHSVLVKDLSTIPYEWSVTATSACGGTATTVPQQFSVATGVVFKEHQQSYTINRDYDQFAEVWVKNQSNEVREVQLSIEDPYDDLIVNFRGAGGVDGTITLLPREERKVQLAIFAQNATLENYSFNATLTSTDGVNTITDVAAIDVRVLFPTNYRVEEQGVDPLSGAIIYRVTNDGLPITDLNIRAVEAGTDLPARVYITPQIVHARLDTDEWLEFKVLPLYSAEEATPVTGHSSSGKMLSGIHRVDSPDVEIVSTVAQIMKRHLMPKGCDAQIYAVTLHNVLLPIPFKARYCTNEEDIDIEIDIPPFVERNHVLGSTLEMGFSPVSAMRPHDTTIYFNGHEIANMPNQVPNGSLRFDVDPSYLNLNSYSAAKQTIHLHTVHNNIGKDEPHHTSQIGGTLYIALEEVTVYVCASSPEEALALAMAGYGFIELPGSFWVNILDPDPDPAGMVWPGEDGTVHIQAHVGNNTTSYTNLYRVEANIEYLDASVSEKILLYDDGLSAHADGTKGDSYFNVIWKPRYGGVIRMTMTAALPDGRVDTDVREFRINGQPDLAVTKVYVDTNVVHNRVQAEITNLGFAVSGPVNVDFVYYLVNILGEKIGDPIHTSHHEINETLERGQFIEVEDTEFTPEETVVYFVEVIVDP